MESTIKKILEKNINFFGDKPKVEKINVGFTNLIFVINNMFILKICSDKENELKFIKEINFYNANKDNHLIPKLFDSSIDKSNIKYMYEIIEKVEGVSLFSVWHTLSEEDREKIIIQLCDAMKIFHSYKGNKYDWCEKTKKIFRECYQKATGMNLFDAKEKKIIYNAYLTFDNYLESSDFVLVHNDLHFDNIIYHNGKIKLIDFERSIFAPIDFELDIIYRMIRKPWKFANEEAEKFVKTEDYKNIMGYIEKYYPEIMNVQNLYKRLAIYDIVYFLKQFIDYPHITELKNDIFNAIKILSDSN